MLKQTLNNRSDKESYSYNFLFNEVSFVDCLHLDAFACVDFNTSAYDLAGSKTAYIVVWSLTACSNPWVMFRFPVFRFPVLLLLWLLELFVSFSHVPTQRSHHLAPLTKLVGANAKFMWKDEQQKAFDTIKQVIGKETLLNFPDFGKPFHIYTDTSDYQLGSVIMQDNRPLAFYSRKLNAAQRN